MNISEKALYLKGLADGLDKIGGSGEGKLWSSLLDLISDIGKEVDGLKDEIDNLKAADEDFAESLEEMGKELSYLEEITCDLDFDNPPEAEECDNDCANCANPCDEADKAEAVIPAAVAAAAIPAAVAAAVPAVAAAVEPEPVAEPEPEEPAPEMFDEPALVAELEPEEDAEPEPEYETAENIEDEPAFVGVVYDITCPLCGKTFEVEEAALESGSVTCPACGETLEFDNDDEEEEEAPAEEPVPEPVAEPVEEEVPAGELYDITCPLCGRDFEVTEADLASGSVTCPYCNEVLEFDNGDDEAEEEPAPAAEAAEEAAPAGELYDITCPVCGRDFEVSDADLASGAVTCPYCSEVLEFDNGDDEVEEDLAPVEVPEEAAPAGAVYDITCPVCGRDFEVSDADLASGAVTCPYCNEVLEFDNGEAEEEPAAEEPAPAAEEPEGEMFEITCPVCGMAFEVDAVTIGTGSVTCPACGEVLEFDSAGAEEAPAAATEPEYTPEPAAEPEEEEELYEIACPVCGTEFSVDGATLAGGSVTCPTCGEVLEFDVPEDEVEEEPAAEPVPEYTPSYAPAYTPEPEPEEEEESYEITCPVCGTDFAVDAVTLGAGTVVCPTCGEILEFDV